MTKTSSKVYLGGTCNESMWREKLIPLLKIDYFNPVVEDWTEEAAADEIKQREICNYNLYVITPKMTGVYAIAELVEDSNKHPHKTLFCYLFSDDGYSFNAEQLISLKRVNELVKANGVVTFRNLDSIAHYLNNHS